VIGVVIVVVVVDVFVVVIYNEVIQTRHCHSNVFFHLPLFCIFQTRDCHSGVHHLPHFSAFGNCP
jgi:hypothetical protein